MHQQLNAMEGCVQLDKFNHKYRLLQVILTSKVLLEWGTDKVARPEHGVHTQIDNAKVLDKQQ